MSTKAQEELDAAGGAGDALVAPPPGDGGGDGAGANGAPDWLAGADDETREWATSKGFKDPAAALKSGREAERAMAEAQQNSARMEGRVAELMERSQQADAGQGPQLSREEQEIAEYVNHAASLYDNGEIDTSKFAFAMMNAGRAQARLEAESTVGWRVGQLEERSTAQDLTRTAQEMHETYDDFAALSDSVMELINKQPKLYATPEGMRAAYGLVKADHARRAAAEGRRAAKTETITDSGRSDGAAAQEASAAIRKELRNARGGSGIEHDPLG